MIPDNKEAGSTWIAAESLNLAGAFLAHRPGTPTLHSISRSLPCAF